jgi:hypothetical protein
MFGCYSGEVKGRKNHKRELYNFCCSPNIVRMIKSSKAFIFPICMYAICHTHFIHHFSIITIVQGAPFKHSPKTVTYYSTKMKLEAGPLRMIDSSNLTRDTQVRVNLVAHASYTKAVQMLRAGPDMWALQAG